MELLEIQLYGQYKGLKSDGDEPKTFIFRPKDKQILAFVGLNGSGKSQLLELIAESFAYLERYKRSDFLTRTPFPFSVVLRYKLQDVHVEARIEKNGFVSIRSERSLAHDLMSPLLLPKYIVGYSSGQNENLQRSFLKNSFQYFKVMRTRMNRIKRLGAQPTPEETDEINKQFNKRYPQIFPALEETEQEGFPFRVRDTDTFLPKMIYLDYDTMGLLFTSLGILPQDELDIIFGNVRFRRINKVVLIYDIKSFASHGDFTQDIRNLIDIVGKDGFVGIGRKTTDEEHSLYSLDHMKGKITIDFTNEEVKEKLIERNYGEPFILFERLYKLQLMGIKNLEGKDHLKLLKDDCFDNIKKPLKLRLPIHVKELEFTDCDGHTVSHDDLSDGELQLMQILSAIRIFNEGDSLFIFDEPETHLNPSWRTFFHHHIQEVLSICPSREEEPKSPQFLISTHSPFLASALPKENVFICSRDEETGNIGMEKPQNQTFGASFDVLIKQLFGMKTLISQTAIDEIKNWLDKENDIEERSEISKKIKKELGESIEKIYLLKRLKGDAS